MKILDIALKDMTRSFRSIFALIFMFGIPLLMTGMFYFMFGGAAKGSQGFSVPVTKVVVADLDQGGHSFDLVKTQFPGGAQARSLGDMVLATLQDKSFATLMVISQATSAETARAQVDSQKAGVALIIPADFSQRFSDLNGQADLELYKDPHPDTRPQHHRVHHLAVHGQHVERQSGRRRSNQTDRQHGPGPDRTGGCAVCGIHPGRRPERHLAGSAGPGQFQKAGLQYTQPRGELHHGRDDHLLRLLHRHFHGPVHPAGRRGWNPAAPIYHAYQHAAVLGGKFLSVGLTVVVQMTVLLVLGRLIFGIQWGSLLPLALVTAGTVLAASTFGIFIISLLKNTKQAGAVLGGVLTVTGMLGMIKIFTMGSSASPAWADLASMFVPQGWAVRGLSQVMNAASLNDILLTCLALLGMSVVFFLIGVLRFQKRYA